MNIKKMLNAVKSRFFSSGKKIVFTLLIIQCSFQIANAFDTTSIKYMPLHVGDFWVYNGLNTFLGGQFSFMAKTTVLFSRNVNSHIYYYLSSSGGMLFTGYCRTDSTTGSLYNYDSTGSCTNYPMERLVDSLAAIVSDTTKNCGVGAYICTAIQSKTIFGENTFEKKFGYSYTNPPPFGGGSYQKSFVKNYGFLYYTASSYGGGGYGTTTLNLKGCRINGVVYGDTSLTGINQIGIEVPSSYSLSQNYPNPFNPATKIRFDIPGGERITDNVQLIIYDILGREVAKLVNEQLAPGTYSVDFDGTNFPSGIYFYRLIAGNYNEIKKMLLLK
jgi:hypothetical protein